MNNESMGEISSGLKYHRQLNISSWIVANGTTPTHPPIHHGIQNEPRHGLSCPRKRTERRRRRRRRRKRSVRGRTKRKVNCQRLAWCGCTAWHRGTRSRYVPCVPVHSLGVPLLLSDCLSCSTRYPFLPGCHGAETLAPQAIAHGTGVRPHYARCAATSPTSGDIVICKLHLAAVAETRFLYPVPGVSARTREG